MQPSTSTTRAAACVLAGLFCCTASSGVATPSPDPSTPPPVIAPTTADPPSRPATAASELSALERAFAGAAAKIRPSVVSITTTKTIEIDRRLPFDDPFFGRFFQVPQGPQRQERHGLGSGVLIDSQGHILTNNHVVDGADELDVKLADDREFAAKIVGTDPKTDLAVIRIDADDLTAATLTTSKNLAVGQWVLAVGSPFGLEQTVSAGIVSALDRGNVGITDYEDFVQTDAAINPGNSGGPLINLAGDVVGINTAIATRSGGNVGIGFAVPSDMAKQILRQLIDHGKVVRGWLGVTIGPLDADMAESFGYNEKGGILVQSVSSDSPAANAGLRDGDIIVALDGAPVDDVASFRNAIASHSPASTIKLALWRDNRRTTIDVSLGKLPDDHREANDHATRGEIGLTLSDLDAATARRYGAIVSDGAVVIAVSPNSIAARAGLAVGDVITAVHGTAVASASEARKQVAKGDLERGIRLRVHRGEIGRYVLLRAK